MSLLRQSAWAGAAAIVGAISRFAIAAVLVRRMSKAAFGQYAYGQWLVDLSFLLCSLGATGAVARYLAEYRHESGFVVTYARRWLKLAIGLPLLAGLLVWPATWVSGMQLSPFAVTMLSLWAASAGLLAMQTAAMTGLQRFDIAFRGNAITGVVMVGGAAALPIGHDDPGRLFAVMAVACMLAAAAGFSLTLSLVKGVPADVDSARWRSIRKYSFNIWITAILWSLVFSRGEISVVRWSLGDAAVAGYASALTLLAGAAQGVMLSVSGISVQLTRLWGAGKQPEAIALARDVMDLQSVLCGIGALVLTCMGPELLTLCFGAAYRGGAILLALFSFSLLSLALSCHNHILQIATDARYNRNVMLLGLVLLFGVSLVMVPHLGLAGAAIARSLTLTTIATTTVIVMLRRWGKVSISIMNLLILSVVVGLAVVAVVLLHVDLSQRAALLALSLGVIGVTLRNRHGRPLFLSIPTTLFQRLRSRTSGA